MTLKSLGDLARGVLRHPLLTAAYIFTAFSVLFTVLQAIDFFIPGVNIKEKTILWGTVILSAVYGLKRAWKPSSIEIPIANSELPLKYSLP